MLICYLNNIHYKVKNFQKTECPCIDHKTESWKTHFNKYTYICIKICSYAIESSENANSLHDQVINILYACYHT